MPTHRTEILTRSTNPTSSAPTVAGDRVYFGVRGDGVPGGRPPRLVAGKYLIFGTDQTTST